MSVLLELASNIYTDYVSIGYIAGFATTGYILYYILEIVKVPEVACGEGKFRSFLENNLPVLKERFWPTLWCCEPRFNTVFAHYIRELIVPKQPYRREILHFSDGGEAALDWREGTFEPNAPVLVALPGVTGCSAVEYMRNIAMTAYSVGVRCVVFNNRGLGGVVLTTPKAYCGASYDDLSEVLRHVKSLHPQSPIALLGVSLGGLITGNYLAHRSEEAKALLATAILISPPWNVVLGTESVEKPYLNRILNRNLANSLIATFERNQQVYDDKEWVDKCAILRSRTIREFDDNFTAKSFGYRDAWDYYESVAIHEKLPRFPVPTLCLSSADDPFQPITGIPIDAAKQSDHVAIVVTPRGGHIGFLEGLLPFSTNQFMQRLVAQYLNAMLHGDNYTLFKS